ncbi:MAG: iron-sulfur cluster biosynthesis transcriptional regulator SufR [Cyanophyceae cyanobacterium]
MTSTHSTSTTNTKDDILQHLLKRQATAQQLADSLGISPQAVRRHLKDLEAEKLVEYRSIQQGMGRPQNVYQLSREGRHRFPQRYGEFTVSFFDTLVETVGEEQFGQVLRKQWQRKAKVYRDRIGSGLLKERVAKLVKLRQEEGYMAELYIPSQTNSTKENYILAEHNCAISEVAESYPSVCGHELEMFADVLPDCTVERTHWLNNGEHRCGYLIQTK